ncbi:uncharacterized protein B0H18DRAFT_913487 [Fomitopsis serialis]|uniref:uncharacterized protein n=1 Tax=Fomitopsis serialis TaxID=139415 RepID=UPI002008D4CB|nr:uncharacterized protein B0H18DRAFT_913487 [Neoantrodia serialis]KAH9917410.1 hypothetical protein B0H18DRAFT_913487 [Neoantrodia serialis]
MREWLPLRDQMLQRLIDLEGPQERRICGGCKGEWSPWRCIDCIGRPSFCTACCLKQHEADYLHRVEHWVPWDPAGPPVGESPRSVDESADEDASSEWGEVETELLPTADSSVEQGPILSAEGRFGGADMCKKLTVADITGVHTLRVTYCECDNAASKPFQLLDMGLYPATVLAPRTAFTFRVLDDFLLANKVSGIAAQSYFERLRRLTSTAFPQSIPDRYRELLRVSRQWRNLKYRKWHGFGHGRGEAGPGDLALGCVACPRPGVNLQPGWEQDKDRWKFTQTFVMDGNFSAEHLKMRRPQDDVSLADGHGFMVTDGPYKRHLKEAIDAREKSSCHAHRAVNQANANRHDMEATGIGAVACGRHGCFVPHAIVDFQKGERQMNMDYALSQALQLYAGIAIFLIMYDVACQYSKHAVERFTKSSGYLHWPAAILVYWGIGLFHIHGHQRDCLPKYSPDFIPGAGRVDGEIIETLWSPLNRISGSTRAMSTSHRKEVIDDHMNDANWRKTVGMAVKMLSRRYRQATKERLLSAEVLQDLETSSDPNRLAEWKAFEARARAERHLDLRVMEVYEVTQEKAPGKRAIQLLLEQEEGKRKETPGLASWLAEGLAIQEQQIAVSGLARRQKADPLLSSQLQLVSRRNRLRRAVDRFCAQAGTFWEDGAEEEADQEADQEAEAFPVSYAGEEWEDVDEDPDVTDELVVIDEPEDMIQPEAIMLPLPSTSGIQKLRALNKAQYGEQELRLRVGQANDALHRLRMAIGLKSAVFRNDVRLAEGYRTQTRAWTQIQGIAKVATEQARVYTLARNAMKRLVMSETAVMQRYRPLHKEDLNATTHLIDNAERNSRHKVLSWIWSVDVGLDTENSDWLLEIHRVNWLREKAKCDRWKEQVVLLEEEMKQTVRSFEFRARLWNGRRLGSPGQRSYAMRQASVWKRLSDEARLSFMRFLPDGF